MGALQERKIDCHNHILDPRRYPYQADVAYKPTGQEIGTEAQLHAVCDTYGVEHCLVVGPNSGYGLDNRCLLDAIARGKGRFKGVAVVRKDAEVVHARRTRLTLARQLARPYTERAPNPNSAGKHRQQEPLQNSPPI